MEHHVPAWIPDEERREMNEERSRYHWETQSVDGRNIRVKEKALFSRQFPRLDLTP